MADGDYTFASAKTRLEEIVTQVRKKDTTLEKSLDLLEEGVRLANQCTELSDHTEWRAVVAENASGAPEGSIGGGSGESIEVEADASAGADDSDGAADSGAGDDSAGAPDPVAEDAGSDSDEEAVSASSDA